MRKLAVIIFILLGFTLEIASAKSIKICTDENLWYPFTFEEKGQSKGLHVDVVGQALTKLGFPAKFTPVPWKRCLKQAETGEVDAVVSASYKKKRAVYLHYPPDASTTKKSKWRITQVEYVVVSYMDDQFEYDGNIKSLPLPVRVPLGYSIIDDIEKEGVAVDTAKGVFNNMAKLIRDKKGVVICLPQTVGILNQNPRFKNKLKIHNIPIKSKSYFIVFSKEGTVSEEDRKKIWLEVVKIREDAKRMSDLLAKY